MGRNNLALKARFNDLLNSDGLVNRDFLSVDEILGISETPEIKKIKSVYTKIIDDDMRKFEILGKSEELIIQLRCRELIRENIKLSYIRNYIYARAIFYRSDRNIKDIRVTVNHVRDCPSKYIDELVINENFITLAVHKIQSMMDKEIEKTREDLKTLLEITYKENVLQ